MVGYTPLNNTNIRTNSNPGERRITSTQTVMSSKDDSCQSLEDIFVAFDPISLEEMDKVKLMNRVDTKFLVGFDMVPVLLRKAVEHYRIVEIDGLRASPYSSIYFDTEDVQMYTMHHNGKLNRYKVRMRSYVSSGDSFLEIKRKSNKGRTSKKRVKITPEQFLNISLDETSRVFIRETCPYEYTELRPVLQNYFYRITLVDKNETERITMDIGLKFRSIGEEKYTDVGGLVIVEMKQDGAARSHFRRYLNEMSVLPIGMSKYCLGMILTNPGLKNNRFKKKIRYINKIAKSNLVINS